MKLQASFTSCHFLLSLNPIWNIIFYANSLIQLRHSDPHANTHKPDYLDNQSKLVFKLWRNNSKGKIQLQSSQVHSHRIIKFHKTTYIAYLNKRTNPYISIIIPMSGHPNRTTNTPPRKHELPFSLCFWKKNLKVLSNPITNANPAINSICKMKLIISWLLQERDEIAQGSACTFSYTHQMKSNWSVI